MCGITGQACIDGSHIENLSFLKKLTEILYHRGPDDEGYYMDENIFLGHRRLSIIDLSTGKQPIFNENEKIVVVFNGEIYNFQNLKKKLQENGHKFKTLSDTEVIVHLYEEKGEEFLKFLNGMFAIALWDKLNKKLILARDRLGEKPLYYSIIKKNIIFASELKSLLLHPEIKKQIDPLSFCKYLLYDYVPSPSSIIKGVQKLLPGWYLVWENGNIHNSPYWDVTFDSLNEKILIEDAVLKLEELLKESVKLRLISDVPLGVFLSGGIDSTTVVSFMAEFLPSKSIKTFTISFKEKSFDESEYAREVAKFFNTHHRESILSPEKTLSLIPEILTFIDEPVADNSFIPTYLLSKFTRQYATVALGGDGGDELFFGYPTFQAHKLANLYKLIVPSFLHKKILKPAVEKLPVSLENISFDFKIKRFLEGVEYDEKVRQFIWIGGLNPFEIKNLVSQGVYEEIKDFNLFEPLAFHQKNAKPRNTLDLLCYLYIKLYLQDDILTKVDRASMANSLEVRAPFLDVNVVDFVTSLPPHYRLKGLKMKYLLKKMLKPRVPSQILKRGKKGFGIPLGMWFKNELKPLLKHYLNKKRIRKEGFLNEKYVETLLEQHFQGKKDNRKPLYSLLVFEMWNERYMG